MNRREKELQTVNNDAQKLSESKEWKPLLVDMNDRTRFEYGYVAGYYAHKEKTERRK